MTSPGLMSGPILGWPQSWYDTNRSIPCPARHCSQVFDTRMQWTRRFKHFEDQWGQREEVPETHTDHLILLLFMEQEACPYCDWAISSSKEDIRFLFDHEQREHGTSDTTDIDGFVRLVRRQALGQLGLQAQELVFWRFLQKLKVHKDFGLISRFFHYPEDEVPIDLANTLLFNRPPPQYMYYPVPPDDFLMHLVPSNNQREMEFHWPEIWNDLREMYRNGWLWRAF